MYGYWDEERREAIEEPPKSPESISLILIDPIFNT